MMSQLRPNNSLSKREEERLVEAGRRVLLGGGYPNPDRIGCPGSEVLKALVERKMDLREAEEWVLHLGMCSPCFIEYTEFRDHAVKQKKLEFAAIGVTLLIVIGIGVWLWRIKGGHETPAQPQEVSLDLRNYLVLRGEESPPGNKSLVLPRGRLDLSIYLPVGSREGDYEVQVVKEPDKVLVSASGSARLENHDTVLRTKLDSSLLTSGQYLLTIRRPGMEWSYYPVKIK
jgi:hypothetical protein